MSSPVPPKKLPDGPPSRPLSRRMTPIKNSPVSSLKNSKKRLSLGGQRFSPDNKKNIPNTGKRALPVPPKPNGKLSTAEIKTLLAEKKNANGSPTNNRPLGNQLFVKPKPNSRSPMSQRNFRTQSVATQSPKSKTENVPLLSSNSVTDLRVYSPNRPERPARPLSISQNAVGRNSPSKPIKPVKPVIRPPAKPTTKPTLRLSSKQIDKPTVPPKLPPKPAVLSEEEHKQIFEACKKFCNANKQLLAVSRAALSKAKGVLSQTKFETLNAQLGTSAEDLRDFNGKFSDLIREASKEFDHKKTCNIACLTLDIANLSSVICAGLKIAAVECESDTSIFKPTLKSITTIRDSLIHVIDVLKSVPDKVDQSLIPQLETHFNTTSTTLVGLVGHKTTGPLIPLGTYMEIEAAIRAAIVSVAKVVNSFNGTLEQTFLTEAKVASCCVAQTWATINEVVNTNTNLLSMPEIREIISNYALNIKQSFALFMEQTKEQVTNNSPSSFDIMKDNEKKIRSLYRDIIANLQAFSIIDTSQRLNIKVNDIKPLDKHYKIADNITSDPESIVPPPPINITQSSIDVPDDYVPSTDNIWDEPEEDEGRVLLTETGNLRCATLNKLIIHTTANLDMNRMKTFITTYRSFTNSEILLSKIIQRYHVPNDANVEALPIQLRCCNSLKYLIETQHEDFSNEFTEKLNAFLEELTTTPAYKKFATIIQTTLQKKRDETQTTKTEIINLTIEEKIPLSPGKLLFIIAEEEIARQLTLVDFRIYKAIKPVELLNQAWSKAKYRHRAKNVLSLVARSTQLTMWVASVILWQETLRGRVRAYTKMVNIAHHMYKLNNFNSLMAVLAGVNTAAIYRLKFTREQIPESTKQLLEELSDLMDPTQAYANYRQKLHDVDPPCVPFLGTYLTDITFIEDGNPDYIQGLINYRKRELVYSVIREIQQYQQQSYQDDYVNIAHFLTELASNDEEKLYDLSLLREPRGATIDQLL